MTLICNLLTVLINVALLAITAKLYTEIHKKKTIEAISPRQD